METDMQLKEFIDVFLEFEKKQGMFQVKIHNVRIWQYLRIQALNDLLQEKGFVSWPEALPRAKVQGRQTLEFVWKRYISCNQFLAHKRDILIVSGDRKYKDGDRYYKDQHAHLLDEYLSASHYLLDVEAGEGYKLQRSRNILYRDLEAFQRIKRIQNSGLLASRVEIEKKIIEPIDDYFGLKLEKKLKQKWVNLVNHFINERGNYIKYYKYLLSRISPKIILVVCSYAFDRMILCEVAKKMHIPVVELEHGRINELHHAYNFYDKMHPRSFPDYVFTFGWYERKVTRWPIAKSHIIPTGHPELENYCNVCGKKKNGKKIVLFISSTTPKIAEYANAVAKELDPDKYQIVFQLHSHEYRIWRRTVGKYLRHPNIKVVGGYEHMVYEELAQADWVVGTGSTMLSEAQIFSAKVAILKIELYQFQEFLYKNGAAILVDSPEQLVKEIEEDTFQPNRLVDLFEKNSLQKMQEAINRIIADEAKRV